MAKKVRVFDKAQNASSFRKVNRRMTGRSLFCKKKIAILAIAIFSIAINSCSKQTTLPYGNYETRVISTQMNEVYLLRAQGKGATKKLAEQQALKQAVHDVIFKNIYLTTGDHNILYPLISDPRVEKQNQNYFSTFFSDNGPYLRFVKDTKEKEKKYHTDVLETCIMNVCVDRGALREFLKADGF